MVRAAAGVAAVALGEQDLAVAYQEQVHVHDGSLRLSHARERYRSPPAGLAGLAAVRGRLAP
jgi:hypothetical protein